VFLKDFKSDKLYNPELGHPLADNKLLSWFMYTL